jgi:DNA-binding response OmpR family regulator
LSDSPTRPGVLVVDDDPQVRQFLGLALPRFGFTVWLAPGGEEAVALFREHRQDILLALLDVCMPGLDGPGTLKALRELEPSLLCCFMTGEPGGHTASGLLALGAERVFLKPFALAELAGSLRGLLGGASGPAG